MTVTAFDAASRQRRGRSISAGAPLALRLRVYVTRGRLDRQIAAGHAIHCSAALALRARQLVHPRTRQRLARDLRGVVEYVDWAGSRRVVSAVVIDRAMVRGPGRESILGLAERLEGSAPVSPKGVALTQLLLTDGIGSPLFNSWCGRTVAEAVWEVADALGADAPTIGFDTVAV